MKFNVEPLLEHVRFLVSQDETELALKALDLVPAYYRDNYPRPLLDLKSKILKQTILPIDLLEDPREMPKTDEYCIEFTKYTKRGEVLVNKLKEANDAGIVPHIVDYGPGDYNFPIAMHLVGLNFTYFPIHLNLSSIHECKKRIGDKLKGHDFQAEHVWFVAYEIIEHLPNPKELRSIYSRLTPEPEKVFFSTPRYTFNEGTPNWEEIGIHHLRAYTPREFIIFISDLFPGYKFQYCDDPVMVFHGEKDV